MNTAIRVIFVGIVGLSLCASAPAVVSAPLGSAHREESSHSGSQTGSGYGSNSDAFTALANPVSVLNVERCDKQEGSCVCTRLDAMPSTVMLPGQARPRVALALGGGGCKALAQIGVLRAFEKSRFKVDCIVGTSFGAVVGSLYAAGVPLDEIQRLAEEDKLQGPLAPSVVARILVSPVKRLLSVCSKRYPGLTSANGLVELLHKKLPEDFSQMKIPFIAVATDLHDGTTYMINSGDPARAVLASCAVPGIIRPIEMGEHLFADGGLRSNLPSNCARATGASLVIAVLTDTPIEPEPLSKFRKLKSIALRVTDVMEAEIDRHHLEEADVVIYPDGIESTPGVTKDPALIRRAVSSGELAARAALPELRQMAGNFGGAIR